MVNNYKQKIRTALAFLCLFASFSSVMAQISAYTFTESTETYSPVVGTNSSATGDDGSQNTVAIGFTFNFGGTDYTTFSINTNGFIRLGANIAGTPWTNTIGTGSGQNPLIAPFWDDNNRGTGAIQYSLSGTSPNQILEIGWNNVNIGGGGATSGTLFASFKIRLHETTNIIEFIYGSVMDNAGALTGSVGLSSNAGFLSVTPSVASTFSTLTANNNVTSAVNLVGKKYTFTPPSNCSGTPTAGAASAPASACSGVNFNLTLTGSSTLADLTYQWQSSPDGVSYTDISGATTLNYSTNQTTSTFYQCIVTCSNGGAFSNSTPIQVNMSSLINCYCSTGLTTTGGLSDAVTNVLITNSLSNTLAQASSGAAPWFISYNNTPLDLVLGSSNTVAITFGTDLTQHSAVWVDWNQNGIFEASENVALSTAAAGGSSTVTYTFAVPITATLGNTRIRIRGASDGAYTAGGACTGSSYGETEDYLVNVICPTIAAPSVTSATACSGNTLNLSASGAITGSTLTWYDAAVAGTIINTGLTFTTPTLTTTTSYWVEESIPGCAPSPLAEVVATISPVDAELVAIDVTCNGYANGSFSLGVISCGTEPFTYSVNSGAFGAIPTDLAAGTYSIVIEDAGSLLSAPITLVISEPSSTVSAPVGTNANICLNESSATISALSLTTTMLPVTEVISFDLAAQPMELSGGSSFPNIATTPNIISSATMNALPNGAVVTSVTFSFPNLTPQGGSYGNDVGFGFTGGVSSPYLAGTGAPNSTTPFSYTRVLANGSVNVSGGIINLNYYDLYSDNAGDECIFPTGSGVATLTINYEYPAPADITWWDAATGGTQLATGATLETIGTSVLADASTPGVYNFYAQAENGSCNAITRTLVTTTVNALPTVSVTSDDTDNTVCENIMVTLTGAGAATYTYTGSVNDGVAFAATSTETYTVTGTDANGCVNTSDITITVNAAPTVTATSDATNDIICAGDDVTLTAGGTAVTYTWDNSVVDGVAFAPIATTTYTVTGVDAIGCENTATITITVNDPIVTASSDATGNAICDGGNVILTGGGATTYTWDNSVVDGVAFAPTATTTYTVTGADALGCENTATITITVNALPTVSVTSDDTDNTVCENTMVTLTGAGAATYTYTGSVNDGVAFAATSTETYTVTGTDVNGCVNTSDITINVNAAPTVTASSDATNDIICAGDAVTLTAGGTAVTYGWDNLVVDGVAFIPVATTTYTLAGVDAIGCTNITTITITVNNPTVTATSDATANTICTGDDVILTGGGAVTYTWDNSVVDGVAFIPSATATYTVTGADAIGCENTATITITLNALPTVSVTSDDTDNTVCENTMVTLTGAGAATYSYTGGVNEGVAFAATSTETYTVTGTDANGCTNTSDITITVNAAPTVTATSDVTNNTLCGSGDVTLTAAGNAVTYTWDNSVVDGVAFTTSSTNTYTVTGVDAIGCENTAAITITVNAIPTVSVSSDDTDNTVCENTMVTLTGAGAATYTYTGSVNDGVAFAATSTETYTVTGTDANGCTNTDDITITVNALPTVSVTSDDTDNTVCENTLVTLTGAGATTYTYTGSVNDGVAFAATSTETYTVTGTDANGCSNTDDITITVSIPTVTAASDVTNNAICGSGDVTLTGGGAVSYLWDNSVVDGVAFTTSSTNTYTVTGTDAFGCTNTATITITVNTLPTVSATSDDANNAICIGSSVVVTGVGANTYTYTGGISEGVAFTPTATNTYTVTGTDANGCVNTGTITITVNQLPIVDLAPFTSPVCAVVTNYSLTNISPLTGVFSGPNVTGTTFNPSAAGVGVHPITYTVTDINGCVGSDVENITVGDCSGIEENSSIAVSVYPNPTNGDFTLSINNANFSNITISIVDIHGKVVYSEMNVTVAQDLIKQINVSDLARGVYFVKLNNGSDISTQKLIIQ